MYTPCAHETDHNTIPFIGLKPLQSEMMLIVERLIINGWWLVGAIGGIMAGLQNFTFVADKLQAIGSMMYVWSTDGTKNEMKRCKRRCNDNGTVAIISPLVKGYLWIINVAAKRRHGWVCSGIFFTAFNSMRNVSGGIGEDSRCLRGQDWKMNGSEKLPSPSMMVRFSFVKLSVVGPQ